LTAPATYAQTGDVARGAYLVNQVSLCGDCHSPGGHGPTPPGREFSGAPFEGGPPQPNPHFAYFAPNLRGLPTGYTQETLAAFLETGRRPDGSRARPPMPQFRFDPKDAQATAAYFASLKP
jgi:cytochrome c553